MMPPNTVVNFKVQQLGGKWGKRAAGGSPHILRARAMQLACSINACGLELFKYADRVLPKHVDRLSWTWLKLLRRMGATDHTS